MVQNQNRGLNLPLTKVSQVNISILLFPCLLKYFDIYSVLLLSLGQCPALEKLLKDFAGTYATGEHIYMV